MCPVRMPSARPQKRSCDVSLPFAVMAEARSWVGTPYRHQGRLRGQAVDCANLIIAVGLALELFAQDIRTPEEFAKRFRQWQGYSRLPNPTRMRTALAAFLIPLESGEAPQGGDVCWLRWDRGPPLHLAILATDQGPEPNIIHAHGIIGRCVEHGFTAEWPGRVESWWRYPELMA